MDSNGEIIPLALQDELRAGIAPRGELGGLQGDRGTGEVADLDLQTREVNASRGQKQKRLCLSVLCGFK